MPCAELLQFLADAGDAIRDSWYPLVQRLLNDFRPAAIRALLHQPSRRSVPQRVRRYAGTEAGEPGGALECRFD